MIDYEDARELVFKNIYPLKRWLCPLIDSQGLALYEDIKAPHGMPLFDNSAVDGYAIQASDLNHASTKNPVCLEKLGYISAGDRGDEKINSGQCIKIATGAPLPNGADTSVMKEDVEVKASHVRFFDTIPKKENIRFRGEDIKKGDIIINAGTVVGPAQIAVLATFGFSKVPVRIVPKVCLLYTSPSPRDVEESRMPSSA